MRFPGATYRNIYVGSQAAAERTLSSIQDWIEKHLRLKVNAAKSGTGRVWERKFLGFRLDRQGRIGIAPESIERFKQKVREMWRANQSRTSNQLRDDWKSYTQGWWGYYRLAEVRKPFTRLEGWIRWHIRKCFWIRWRSANWTGARAKPAGCSCPDAQDCADGPGRVEDGGYPDHANGAPEPDATSVRLPCTIGSCKDVASCWVQPPDAENRTSGGVGGCVKKA